MLSDSRAHSKVLELPMSVLPSDDRSGIIGGHADHSDSSGRKGRLTGAMFAVLAGVAMAGWLFLIAKMLWAFVSWLVF
jgi:hypothetical protein